MGKLRTPAPEKTRLRSAPDSSSGSLVIDIILKRLFNYLKTKTQLNFISEKMKFSFGWDHDLKELRSNV